MLLPNTTQVPNVIFDTYLEQLKPTELKVLLIIIRQTLGWIQNENTKKRKEKDWISTSQLRLKTGYSRKAISLAIDALCQKDLIEIFDRNGNPCFTPLQRRGKTKLFYRLVTKGNTPPMKSNVNTCNSLKSCVETTEQDVYEIRTTKETHTKEQHEKLFMWDAFIDSLYDNPNRYLNIIAYFFEQKNILFDTRAKAQSALQRHLRAAKLLSPFTDEEITQVTERLKREFPQFTIETIYKYLTR